MQDPTLVLTPECTLVYPELFEPTIFGNETEAKYRATFLINIEDDLKPMREACRTAAHKKFGTGIDLKTLRYPIRDGNEKAKDENGNPDPTNFYHNRVFIAAKSKFRVPIVNVYNEEIANEEEVYGGCIVRAYLSFFGYAYMGNGISAGLRAVCKISDGEPLGGGRVNTGEAFKDFIKPKDSFMDHPPGQQADSELGHRNQEWGDAKMQEPPGGMMRQPGDEDSIPF